jgi:hypothetical protein
VHYFPICADLSSPPRPSPPACSNAHCLRAGRGEAGIA